MTGDKIQDNHMKPWKLISNTSGSKGIIETHTWLPFWMYLPEGRWCET